MEDVTDGGSVRHVVSPCPHLCCGDPKQIDVRRKSGYAVFVFKHWLCKITDFSRCFSDGCVSHHLEKAHQDMYILYWLKWRWISATSTSEVVQRYRFQHDCFHTLTCWAVQWHQVQHVQCHKIDIFGGPAILISTCLVLYIDMSGGLAISIEYAQYHTSTSWAVQWHQLNMPGM